MRRTSLFLLVASGLLASAAPARGYLFEDTFGGSGALDASKWDVSIGESGVTSVQQSGGYAVFSIASGGSSGAYGQALTDATWDPATGLTWTSTFKSTGGDAPKVYPFWYTSPAGNLKVYLRYDDTAAVLYSTSTNLALRDAGNNTFLPTSGNSYLQTLTVTLDETNVLATISGTTNGSTYTNYTATLAHGLNLTDVFSHDAANFGIRVDNGSVGSNKTVKFDSVTLAPEPATLGLLAAGALLGVLARRRRAA